MYKFIGQLTCLLGRVETGAIGGVRDVYKKRVQLPYKLAHDLPGAYGEEQRVTYVIAEPCIDVLDRACVEECPVDCIYEGERALYIQPDECVDCGACEPVCPVEAIFYEDDVPGQWADFTPDTARFFAEPLAGRPGPLNSPGGAAKIGRVGADTALVAGHPPRALSLIHISEPTRLLSISYAVFCL